MRHVVTIGDGEMRFIWNDAMRPLVFLGQTSIRRASHVEPTADNRWTADMGPSGGPVLGPFDTHAEAIAAELAWLGTERGL